jgi:polyisoprenoid-binding protein YceI
MFKSITLSLFLLSVVSLSAQKYYTKTGTIKFFSHTTLEDIKAENRKVVSVIDSATGALEFSLLIKSFDFPNDLMEQHFNESYLESSKFPKATFKGKITDISKVDFGKDGTYTVNYSGKLTIKDVTKDISGTATFVIKNGKITSTSNLKIKPKDYNISIPATAAGKIAEELDVDIIMDYTKK